MKRIVFVGKSLEDLKQFSEPAKREAGYQLSEVQKGLSPTDWKPMQSIGVGVKEIRIQDEHGQFRVIYIAKLKNKIYVLHAFQKKTRKTSKKDIALAQARLKSVKGTK